MRIAVVADHPPFTGIGNYSFKIANNLRAIAPNQVDFYYVLWSTREWRPSELSGAKILETTSHWTVKSPAFYAAHLRSPVPRGYDVYHLTHPLLTGVSPSASKSVATVEDLIPFILPGNYSMLFGLQFRLQAPKLSRMRKLIAISQSTKSDIMKLLGVPDDMIEVIPFGVDEDMAPGPSVRSTLGIPTRKKVILHVGTEERRKNIPFLLRVFAKVKHKMGDVVLVRVGQARPDTMKTIRSLSLDDDVFYTGTQNHEALKYYYRSSDLFLFPSTYEGFGLPPLEAQACGCPVIASSTSSLPEVVGDGGLLLPLNTERWATEVCNVLLNDELRLRLIKDGLRRSRNFTWRKAAEMTLKLYSELH